MLWSLFFRLVEIWREIYGQALQFQNKLRSDSSLVNRNKELENMSKVISQIQESLQRAGDDLEEGPALYSITGSTQTNSELFFKIIKTDFISVLLLFFFSRFFFPLLFYRCFVVRKFCFSLYPGEEHFISGEYSECIQVWRDQLWEERARGMLLTTSC